MTNQDQRINALRRKVWAYHQAEYKRKHPEENHNEMLFAAQEDTVKNQGETI